jgi:hypothetical protein
MVTPFVFYGAIIFNSYFAFRIAQNKSIVKSNLESDRFFKRLYGFYWIVAIVFVFWAGNIFSWILIDPKSSDIMPSIILYVDRFVSGVHPYLPTDFGGWVVRPNYFTMRWAPYVITKGLGLDHRFLPIVFYLIAIFLGLIFRSQLRLRSA